MKNLLWYPTMAVRMGAALLMSAGLSAARLHAQVEARPELRGRVLVAGEPLPDARVLLHRVTAEDAGEVDTVQSGADGSFRFLLPSVPNPGERSQIYFAAVRYQGILYFGAAVSEAAQLDSLYTIAVYDTLVAPVGGGDLALSTRYLILDPIDEGWHVTDIFQVRNESERTLVPAEGGVTWRHPLPPTARDAEFGVGDLPADAMDLDGGDLSISAPVSPGDRQFVVQYTVPGLDGLSIPFAVPAAEVELLVREPAPPLEVDQLAPLETVEMEPGTNYRRFGGSVPAAASLGVRLGEAPARVPAKALALMLSLVLAGLGVYAVSRRRQQVPVPVPGAPPVSERERLLLEIARIDLELERAEPGDEASTRLRDRRAELLDLMRDRR